MKPTIPLSLLIKCMSVTRKGHRYWAHGVLTRRGVVWKFWSDHKWPFYHGGITLPESDPEAAARAFVRWLPFEVEVR